MVKKLTIPCSFGGQSSPVDLYIGKPNSAQHPLNFQAKWLNSEKGGSVPQDVMDSVLKIQKIAEQNNVSFEELCFYAITVANGSCKENIPEYNKLLLENANK
ncbi:MAG: DUF2610 domain-containing protein [Rickettsiales bacterium]|nr:DUF2610 domain-containing protein [Rickettsiales bacterium]